MVLLSLFRAIPDPVRSWFQAMAGSINIQPEFLFMGAITVTSCLMGPDCRFGNSTATPKIV